MFNLPVEYDKLSSYERRLVREQYAKEQHGLCMYCGHELSEEPPKRIMDKKINSSLFPPNMLKHPVHLDHDHITGLTRGAVHARCNAVMWQYDGD